MSVWFIKELIKTQWRLYILLLSSFFFLITYLSICVNYDFLVLYFNFIGCIRKWMLYSLKEILVKQAVGLLHIGFMIKSIPVKASKMRGRGFSCYCGQYICADQNGTAYKESNLEEQIFEEQVQR